jgi:ribonuclease inhibitor
MIVVIDGSKIGSERELHELLHAKLRLGDFYGYNSAALWDRLTTDVERPIQIIWKNAMQSRLTLGDATFDRYAKLFNDVEAQDAEQALELRFGFTVT